MVYSRLPFELGVGGLVVSLLGAVWLLVKKIRRQEVPRGWIVVACVLFAVSLTSVVLTPMRDVVVKVSSGDSDD